MELVIVSTSVHITSDLKIFCFKSSIPYSLLIAFYLILFIYLFAYFIYCIFRPPGTRITGFNADSMSGEGGGSTSV